MKRTAVFIMLLAAAVLIAACGGEGDNGAGAPGGGQQGAGPGSGAPGESGGLPGAADGADTENGYSFPEGMSGGGSDFRFLTPTTNWFYYTDIVFEAPPAEVLDSAIYNRNRRIEEIFDINITVIEYDINEIYAEIRKAVNSSDNVFDAAFAPAFSNGNIGSLITQNMFLNLRAIPTLNLSEEWWNQTMIKEASIGGGNNALYYAGCDINIATLQSVTCVYFNEDMMTDLDLDLPYGLVREGKWTFDAFFEYQRAGARLNGADSFAWDPSGEAVYGFTSYGNSANALLMGAGEKFIVSDEYGMPQIAFDGERFINALEKIQDMLVTMPSGYYLHANSDPPFHYEPIFRNGRALMTMGELKAASVFREMDATFGVVPVPKLDENQQDYYCHLIFATPLLVVPTTNSNAEFTGAVIDALAYVSYAYVTPILFDVSVSQKQLRNEESIEMLGLIRNSGSFEVGSAYGWTSDLYSQINATLGNGARFNAATFIDRSVDRVRSSIDRTVAFFE
jgi:ABC-type glycerol-3-phosphate transport system substrate-binding protein